MSAKDKSQFVNLSYSATIEHAAAIKLAIWKKRNPNYIGNISSSTRASNRIGRHREIREYLQNLCEVHVFIDCFLSEPKHKVQKQQIL